MLRGILVIYRSGVLIASKGKAGELDKASRLSNLISATLFMAETIKENTVKSIKMGDRTLTITQCPTYTEVLVITITDKEDENAPIITNYAAEVVDDSLSNEDELAGVSESLNDKVENILETKVFKIGLPSIEEIKSLTQELYPLVTGKSYREGLENLQRHRMRRRENQKDAYHNMLASLSKKREIPHDVEKAMRKGVDLFYQCEFLPAFYYFSNLTESNMGSWAKLLSTATGLTLLSFCTKAPSPQLIELKEILTSVKDQKGQTHILKTLLERYIECLTNPLKGIKDIREFLGKYSDLLLKALENTDGLKKDFLAIIYTTVAFRSVKMMGVLANFFEGKSPFFHLLYLTRKDGKKNLLSFEESYKLPGWGEVYDSIIKMQKNFKEMRQKEETLKEMQNPKEFFGFRGILHVRFLYFLATVVDAFKGVRNLPKEAVDFLMEANREIHNQILMLASEPGFLRVRDYIGIFHYSTFIRRFLLEILPPNEEEVKKISKQLLLDYKKGFASFSHSLHPDVSEILDMKVVSIFPNVTTTYKTSFKKNVVALVFQQVLNFFKYLERSLRNLPSLGQWVLMKNIVTALTALITDLDPSKKKRLLLRLFAIHRDLATFTLAKGMISWFFLSSFLLCTKEVITVTVEEDKLLDILRYSEKLKRILFEPTEKNWRKKWLAEKYLDIIKTYKCTHERSFPKLQKIVNKLQDSLLEYLH
ncbi:MAG: hypothetical protein GWO20_03530 [Candidatus Korarchaeota archaeon]|nr:hypothetical protein [Candidatus Korarchaeota archaeon]NIU81945.1 hypothetical protein [Candidatus Thorarchaeota archaeon]NIW12402.1 hypothetical protein [Candidatus Thorarchaeota archaeon]NIW51195.1 hypothetical protein [Candidatus Korarchaeota archaeon]